MRIAIVGTGYVGLVTATCFAEMGNSVRCVDIDQKKVDKMKRGVVPIYEPYLEGMFERNVEAGRLEFTTSLADGIRDAVVIFLALPTPPNNDGSADLSFVLDVSEKLGPLLKNHALVVNKSTVPVGTADRVAEQISKNTKVSFDVVSNPEFLREGFAVNDFMKPDRVVVGTDSTRARKIMESLYAPFLREGNQLMFMDRRSAEMTKHAANAFLAMKISYMNEVANACEVLGANVDWVREGIGSDERIGKRFLQAGIGYGGDCFPKDIRALQYVAEKAGYDFKIIRAVGEVNEQQKRILTKKVLAYYGDKIKGKTFALWGLAFKPDTDDIRESPGIGIIKDLTAAGAKVQAYDPEAMDKARELHQSTKGLTFAEDEYAALKNADALLIATEWEVFRTPDFQKIKELLRAPVVFDGRNVYPLELMKGAGFYYNSIGREIIDNA